tara:strand:- start:446 stop:685 length:240 start_codon:yes stop_codon:yes gene_type:complete
VFGNNVGSIDRTIRALAGGSIAFAELTGYLGSVERYFEFFALAMAIWLLGTGVTGTCPTYTLFGLSTCATDEEEAEEEE